ncbi:MAG TPA: hypothetical protein VM847_13045, partial [Tahibacter sp.]|nr:hypothetical protein [Tahibacter sp.]
ATGAATGRTAAGISAARIAAALSRSQLRARSRCWSRRADSCRIDVDARVFSGQMALSGLRRPADQHEAAGIGADDAGQRQLPGLS